MKRLLLLLALAVAAPCSALGAQDASTGAPPELALWRDWALHGRESAFCPRLGNEASRQSCLFADYAKVEGKNKSLMVEQRFTAFAESFAELPYADGLWPQDVTLDAKPAIVAESGGKPVVRLSPGEHELKSAIYFERQPQVLRLPAATAFVELILNGVRSNQFNFSSSGVLELGVKAKPKEQAEHKDEQEVGVFRLLDDSIPFSVSTLIKLKVSGKARKLELPKILPQGSLPLEVRSSLPLAFGPDGSIKVLAGAGSFELEVKSRMPERVESFGPALAPFGPEIWSFKAEPDLRSVELRGLPGVDPKNAEVPAKWQGFPAYLAQKGAKLELAALSRGAPSGANELTAERAIWLDFDGKGATLHDNLSGSLGKVQSLGMLPPGKLGRVSLNGQDQPIVILPSGLYGVEIGSRLLSLSAESRLDDLSLGLPLAGFDVELHRAKATLNLPPGYTALAVLGSGKSQGDALSRWNLLAMFLCLLITIAGFKLRGPVLAGILLLFLGLSWFEPEAPQMIWFWVLGLLAIRDFILARPGSGERLRRLSGGAYQLSLLCLAVLALAFVFSELKRGLYPQLQAQAFQPAPVAPAPMPAQSPQPKASREVKMTGEARILGEAAQAPSAEEALEAGASMDAAEPDKARSKSLKSPAENRRYDPAALVQTGPGLPNWSQSRLLITQDNPLERGQGVRVVLLGPGANLALAFLRVFLLLAAIAGLAGFNWRKPGLAGLGLAAILALCPAFEAQAGEFPPQAMLDEYAKRLAEPDKCFPNCLGSIYAEVSLSEAGLCVTQSIDAETRLAAPLPWLTPEYRAQSLTLDGKAARTQTRLDGKVYMLLERGKHRVAMCWPSPQADSFQLNFGQQPKFVQVNAPDYLAQGLSSEGELSGALRLSRKAKPGQAASQAESLEPAAIDPYYIVEREIFLGLEWRVKTKVRRVTPAKEPSVAQVALLPGESVLTQGIEVKEGLASLNFAAGTSQMVFDSRLNSADKIVFKSPDNLNYVQEISLAPQLIFDVASQGPPAVRLFNAAGLYAPLYKPWPGEELKLSIARPEAAPGNHLTLKRSSYALKFGERLGSASLNLSLTASKGGRMSFNLPDGASFKSLKINGNLAPKAGESPNEVSLPYLPGTQEVVLDWEFKSKGSPFLQALPVNLGQPGVNLLTTYDVPAERFVVFVSGGGLFGPAVRIWGYLAGLAIISFGLGYLKFVPLSRLDWFLLGLGLTQAGDFAAAAVVLWLVALGLKARREPLDGWFWYDAGQIALVLLSAFGLGALYQAVQNGLLGLPQMHISGPGSTASHLAFRLDRSEGPLFTPEVLTAPLWLYRGIMLAWALWLAFKLINWLKFAWESLGHGGYFRNTEINLKLPQFKKKADKP